MRSIDYKGEEVKTAQQTSWANLAPALPPEVGTVDLEQVVDSGCLHYVQHFEEYLLPKRGTSIHQTTEGHGSRGPVGGSV